jgi:methyl-accepting chemotaxis protein
MKTKTPNLAEMGVLNPEQIIGYTTVHVTEDMDVLQLNYRRPKNSFLPKRRRYEFKRVSKPMPGSELRGAEAIRFDISPILARAIAELDSILADGKRMTITKQNLKDELGKLNAELNERIAHLSEMIDALD